MKERLDTVLKNFDPESSDYSKAQNAYRELRSNYYTAALSVARSARAEAIHNEEDQQMSDLTTLIDRYEHELGNPQLLSSYSQALNLKSLPEKLINDLVDKGLDKGQVKAEFQRVFDEHDTPSFSFSLTPRSTHDHKELFKLQKLQFAAARQVALKELEALSPDSPQIEKLQEFVEILDGRLSNLEADVLLKGDKLVGKKEMKDARTYYPKKFGKELAQTGVVRAKDVGKLLKEAFIDQLNSREWKTVSHQFAHHGRKIESTQRPAAEINPPESVKEWVGSVFENKYDKGGVCCVDATNIKHANNLWQTDLSIDGEQAYFGIRHGIVDPHRVKDPSIRESGARTKAREVLMAALASKPDLFRQAVAAGNNPQAPVPVLTTLSTSLVTQGKAFAAERRMQAEQNKAFEFFTDPAQQPVTLEVPGPDGKPCTIRVELQQYRMNLPVNGGGQGRFSYFTGGRESQKRMNDPSIDALVGKPNQVGIQNGLAGDVIKGLLKKEQTVSAQLIEARNDSRAAGLLPRQKAALEARVTQLNDQMNELSRERRTITSLARQIQDIYRHGRHHHHEHDAYKLAARVSLLAHKTGVVPLTNCKSGKDRTGMLDAEIKFLAARIDPMTGAVPEPGRIESSEDRELFHKMLMETGNLEIQEYNVGARGYKTQHVGSIPERVGDPVMHAEMLGMYKSVGS